VDQLYWAGAFGVEANYQQSKEFCADLGGALPTEREYDTFRRALGFKDHWAVGVPTTYNPLLFPDLNHHEFWLRPGFEMGPVAPGVYDGRSGRMILDHPDSNHSVNCVFRRN
jgi:hypothetical protein